MLFLDRFEHLLLRCRYVPFASLSVLGRHVEILFGKVYLAL